MARPQGNDENPVSLFPFLSILACVIGTLILLIASVSLTQIESEPEEELVDRVEAYEQLEEQEQAIDEALQRLLQQLSSLDDYKQQLAKLRQQEEQLRTEQQEARQENRELQEKLAELDAERRRLLEQIAKLNAQKARQEEMIAQLIEEIQRRRRVNSAPTVRVEPGEGQFRRGNQPTFVELDAKGLVLDPGGKKVRVAASKIQTDPAFQELLATMAGDYDKILVVLIRQDGYRFYPITERTARYSNVMTTKLPIVGEGELDLSRF